MGSENQVSENLNKSGQPQPGADSAAAGEGEARQRVFFDLERVKPGRWESRKPALGFPLFHRPSWPELWECGNLAGFWRDFQGAREKGGKPALGFGLSFGGHRGLGFGPPVAPWRGLWFEVARRAIWRRRSRIRPRSPLWLRCWAAWLSARAGARARGGACSGAPAVCSAARQMAGNGFAQVGAGPVRIRVNGRIDPDFLTFGHGFEKSQPKQQRQCEISLLIWRFNFASAPQGVSLI
jgi:hypothetical protein